MKIELRNIKHAKFASQETECFEATVYLDGKKAGVVSNDGHGGCNFYHPDSLRQRLDAHAATLPDIVTSELKNDDGSPFTYRPDADSLVGDLLADYLDKKELKRLCGKKVLFRIDGEDYQDGEYRTLKCKYSPEARDYLVKKYGPSVSILNEQL